MQNWKKGNNSRKKSSPRAEVFPNNAGSHIWLCGKHPVQTVILQNRRQIQQILLTKNSVTNFEEFLNKNSLSDRFKNKIRITDNDQIEAVVGAGQVHQGVAIQCSKLKVKNQLEFLTELHELEKENLPNLLLLDQISDPHNVGAIIRSAAAFGVKKIIFSEHNAPKENATIVKSSAGTIDFVDLIAVPNFSTLMEKLKKLGYWCAGLDGCAKQSISELKEFDHIALIVGSEGKGIRDLVKKNCDLLVKIEISGEVESLNASVAAALALNEIKRS